MGEDFLEDLKGEIKKAVSLAREEHYKEAVTILTRCMRKLEAFIGKVEGAKKLEAIMLLKTIGNLQTEYSEKYLEKMRESEDIEIEIDLL